MSWASTNTEVVLCGTVKHPEEVSYDDSFTRWSVEATCSVPYDQQIAPKHLALNIVNRTSEWKERFKLYKSIPVQDAIEAFFPAMQEQILRFQLGMH